jgi:hypothetical protein
VTEFLGGRCDLWHKGALLKRPRTVFNAEIAVAAEDDQTQGNAEDAESMTDLMESESPRGLRSLRSTS